MLSSRDLEMLSSRDLENGGYKTKSSLVVQDTKSNEERLLGPGLGHNLVTQT